MRIQWYRGHYITIPNNAFWRANPLILTIGLHCFVPQIREIQWPLWYSLKNWSHAWSSTLQWQTRSCSHWRLWWPSQWEPTQDNAQLKGFFLTHSSSMKLPYPLQAPPAKPSVHRTALGSPSSKVWKGWSGPFLPRLAFLLALASG